MRSVKTIKLMASALLAVDCGRRAGVSVYGCGGAGLLRYAPCCGRERLEAVIASVMPNGFILSHLVLEGRYNSLAWQTAAEEHAGRSVDTTHMHASEWRKTWLTAQETSSGRLAKAASRSVARQIMHDSGMDCGAALDHNVAESLLVGAHAAHQRGWLHRTPLVRRDPDGLVTLPLSTRARIELACHDGTDVLFGLLRTAVRSENEAVPREAVQAFTRRMSSAFSRAGSSSDVPTPALAALARTTISAIGAPAGENGPHAAAAAHLLDAPRALQPHIARAILEGVRGCHTLSQTLKRAR